MSYTVLARKWRPSLFSEIVGQNHVSKTLKNAILSDRIAHGYIFTGPRGVGKTSAARIFAKALNCQNRIDGEPCNQCHSCKEIANGTNMDVIEIDGASNNSVDNIRDLRDNIRFSPTSGKYKIYIIDEVHMLSKGAFNALLKTLEEPPPHAIFIFATTEIHKVLPTILSRCQRFDFKRISVQEIINRLTYICQQENITIDSQSLLQIAKKADGGMRDSQSLLDQMISFCGNVIRLEDVNATLGILNQEIYFSFVESFSSHNSGAALTLINKLFQDGHDLGEVIFGLEDHLRNLLIAVSLKSAELIDSTDDIKERYLTQAQHFSEVDILRIVTILQKTEYAVKTGQNPKIKLELAFAKICQLDTSQTLSDLLEGKKKSPDITKSQIQTQKIEATQTDTGLKQDLQSNTSTHVNEPKHVSVESEQSQIHQPNTHNIEAAPVQVVESPKATNPMSFPSVKPPIDNQTEQILSKQDPVPPFEPMEITHSEMPSEDEQKPEIRHSDVYLSADSDRLDNLDVVKDLWERFIESIRKEKPSLYVNLFHSIPKSIVDGILTIYFDATARGMVNLQTFERNKPLITDLINRFSQTNYSLKSEQIAFEKLGFKKEFNDINTIVKNLRSGNENFDQLMNMLGLDVIDMEESNGF